jgi:TonB family protein
MKLIVRGLAFIALFICSATTAYNQTRTEYLDPQLLLVGDTAFAKFIRTVEIVSDTVYRVTVVYKSNNQLMMKGAYLDKDLNVENGWFEYYFANGFKESEGRCKRGSKVGNWKRWNYDQRPKPDRFYPDELTARKNRVTKSAQPPGGVAGLQKYFTDSLYYPDEALERNIEGTVYVTFIVDSSGDIIQPEVSRGVHYLLDDEALRFISNMSAWTPATRNGISVDSSFILPIVFNSKTARAQKAARPQGG